MQRVCGTFNTVGDSEISLVCSVHSMALLMHWVSVSVCYLHGAQKTLICAHISQTALCTDFNYRIIH